MARRIKINFDVELFKKKDSVFKKFLRILYLIFILPGFTFMALMQFDATITGFPVNTDKSPRWKVITFNIFQMMLSLIFYLILILIIRSGGY